MMFIPKHLTPEQITHLTDQYLAAAEKQAMEAWINHQCNPGNRVREVAWEVARDDLALLEAEVARWLSSPPQP
jgi:hypothetical protein